MAPAGQAQEHLHRRAAGGDQPGDRPRPHQLLLVGAQTGRLSSTDPNLQNIPIRTAIGRHIREAFVPEPGNVLLAADYSQIELRLAAHMADVPALKEAFAAGEDIHARTAQEMFGTVDRDTRARAKTVNFAILYGISRWGLGGRLGDRRRTRRRRSSTAISSASPASSAISTTRSRACASAAIRRRCSGARPGSRGSIASIQHERQGAERAAINAPIQGTSADIIKRAMARMSPALADAGLAHVKMLLQVHDELVFELPEGDVAAATPVIERVMAEAALPAVKLDVPLGDRDRPRAELGRGALSWRSDPRLPAPRLGPRAALIAAAIGIAVALVMHYLLYRLLTRLARASEGKADDLVVERLATPTRYAMAALGLGLAARETVLLAEVWQRVAGFVMPPLIGWIALAALNAFVKASALEAEARPDDSLAARRRTRLAIFSRIGAFLVVFVTVGLMLLAIPGVRDLGLTLMASAGLAGLAVGAAAQPALKSLIAGLQMALTEPINIGDLVTVDGQSGRVEDIKTTLSCCARGTSGT